MNNPYVYKCFFGTDILEVNTPEGVQSFSGSGPMKSHFLATEDIWWEPGEDLILSELQLQLPLMAGVYLNPNAGGNYIRLRYYDHSTGLAHEIPELLDAAGAEAMHPLIDSDGKILSGPLYLSGKRAIASGLPVTAQKGFFISFEFTVAWYVDSLPNPLQDASMIGSLVVSSTGRAKIL